VGALCAPPPPPPGGRGEGGKCTASQLSTCLCHLLFTRAALRASKLLRCGYVPSGHFSYLTDRCPWHYWTRVTSRFNHPCCIIILCGCHVLVELGRVWREIKRNVCFCFTYALFWLFGQKSQLTARPPPPPLSPFTARSQNIPLATFAIVCTWELKIRRVKRKLEKKKLTVLSCDRSRVPRPITEHLVSQKVYEFLESAPLNFMPQEEL